MNTQTQKRLFGNQRLVDRLDSARTDSHLLRFCGMPSEESHRIITFKVILGDLCYHLESEGWQGFPLSRITARAEAFINCINTFIEIVGFPSECWSEFQVSIEEGDAEALAVACRHAISAMKY